MRTNVKAPAPRTHEGGKAIHITYHEQLRRSVMSCLLWEQGFYEDGVEIGARIAELVPKVEPASAYQIAVEARGAMNLRHVPLWLTVAMTRAGHDHRVLVSKLLEAVIQRPDEMAEFLALYWKDGKVPLAAQVKKGLAKTFRKWDEYRLAKYNRDGAIKLRDVLFLCHSKPRDEAQAELWKRLIDGKLATPDTWEVAISGVKADDTAARAAAWTRLISEGKLGALALLRNLRNMRQDGVEYGVVQRALLDMKVNRVLPFRFIAAAKADPQFEPELEDAMIRSIANRPKIEGHTAVVVDVSGSMNGALSGRGTLTYMDAACGIAMLARELCSRVTVFTFSDKVAQLAPRRGFALRDLIIHSLPHQGTCLRGALKAVEAQGMQFDRYIVITDEQSQDGCHTPKAQRRYMINIASAKNGVGYRAWTHIDGFSEAVLRWIAEVEKADADKAPD